MMYLLNIFIILKEEANRRYSEKVKIAEIRMKKILDQQMAYYFIFI